MSFISIEYLAFLIFFVCLYYILPKKFRWITLLIANIIFYYVSSGSLLLYLLFSIFSVYCGALIINRQSLKAELLPDDLSKEEKKEQKKIIKKKKKKILIFMILINFGILFILKYLGFMVRNVNILLSLFNFNKLEKVSFILPLGISYYTLMTVSYIVDVYREKIEPEENFIKLFLYLSFFPQMVEGPIVSYEETANKVYEPHSFNYTNIVTGFNYILIGIFKKLVIADRCGLVVDKIFGGYQGSIILLGAILYTLQIYAEFSGCMNIVYGSAKLFGIDLPENFRRPFFSRNVQEFWRRWHITLGVWIKNYIFYPISLSKMNLKVTEFTKKKLPDYFHKIIVIAFPLLFVWLFNGIWHGASWKYVAYALYYYSLIMVGVLFKPLTTLIKNKLKITDNNIFLIIIDVVRTTFLVIIGMMLFRSHSLMTFVDYIRNIFKPSNVTLLDFDLVNLDYWILGIYVVILFVFGLFAEFKHNLVEKINKSNFAVRYIVFIVLILLIAIFGIYGEGYDVSSFIYGQF